MGRTGSWFGLVFGGVLAGFYLLDYLVPPGLPAWWALIVVVGALVTGLIIGSERLAQRGVWKLHPFLTAVPLSVVFWAAREPLEEWTGTPWLVAIVVAAGMRGLAEVTIAAAIIGVAVAGNAAIFHWYAVPALAGTVVELVVLRPVREALLDGARAATPNRPRRARTLPLLALPIALCERGAERLIVVHFIGATYGLTHKPATAVWWDKWAVRLSHRRGLIGRELVALRDLAVNLHATGRHDEALATIARARAVVAARLTGREATDEGIRLSFIEARVRRDKGDISGAVAIADAALDELADGRDGARFDFLMFKGGLVGILLHDEEAALAYLDEARKMAADGHDRTREFMATYNYATAQVRLRRYGEAEETLRNALELAEGAEVGIRVMATGGMANLFRLQDRLDEAEDWYRRAAALSAGLDGSVGMSAETGMAMMRLAKGDVAAARRTLDQVVIRAERLNTDAFRRMAYLSAGKAYERDGTAADLRRAYDFYAQAIGLLEHGRASLETEADRLRYLGGEARVEVYERMVATCVALGRPVDAFDFAERGKARALAERFGEVPGSPFGYQRLRDLLAAAGAPVLFVEYFTTAESVVLVGARAEWAEPRALAVAMDRAALRRFTLTNFGSVGRVREMVLGGLEDLWHTHDVLVSPVAEWSSPGDLVVLAPHGLLHYLPLHALRLGDQYLIERNPVSYTASAAVLHAGRAAARRRPGSGSHHAMSGSPHGPSGSRHAVFGDPNDNLPYARAEAIAVAGLLRAQALLGPEVTRAAVTEALAGADIAHYAGHARFDEADPMASGLCLADGSVLTARDVAELEGPRLATLSGCETGISRQHPGDDVQGLVRGFLSAGTATVLASLWRVPDDSAGYLMTRFYGALRDSGGAERNAALRGDAGPHGDGAFRSDAGGLTKAEALREAILSTRGERDAWRSLHHWAPFTIVGDWE